jgi:glycosyltransferase involved in cell wall biosynthesis
LDARQSQEYGWKPRLFYLVTQSGVGGAQTHILHCATALRDEFEVAVGVGAEGTLTEQLRERGVPFHVIPSLMREIDPVRDVRAVVETARLFRRVRPDLVSCHSSKAGIAGRAAARWVGVPALFTAHGWAFSEGVPEHRRRLYIHVERVAARWARRIICVSEYERHLALRHGVGRPEQLVTIHNGMPELSDGYRAEPGKGGPVRLIMVARFSEQKDHLLVLRALAGLDAEADFELLFAGEGELEPWARETAEKLGLGSRVRFLGTRRDVPELLARAHVFVLASNWEGFPRSILEAMRAGLPVVASDVGGSREAVVEGQTGFLVARGDAEMLRDRLRRLLLDAELRTRMGAAGYARFHGHFTFERMLEKTKRVYYEILEEAGAERCG